MNGFFNTFSIIIATLLYIGEFLLSLWWIWIPWLLFLFARDLWLKHKRTEFINKINWVLLEIRPPSEIKKTARAMEQFFAALHGAMNTPTLKERYLEGALQRWFSLEIVSLGGEIHFFICTPSLFRNLVEANIYAQYPEAEINEAADYVNNVPDEIPDKDYDLWGTELMLVKEDAYPIRTYLDFEKELLALEQRIDPMASILETMSKLSPGEQIWIQTLVRPVGDKWKQEGEKLRDKLVGRKVVKKEGLVKKEAVAWKDAGKSEISHLITGKPVELTKEEKEEKPPSLTHGEQEVVKAIERNISKIGFDSLIRFVYLGRKDDFKRPTVSAVIGNYKQFGTQDLNAFRPNPRITTMIDYEYQLKETREAYRKKRILADYKKRDFVQQSPNISYLNQFLFERLPVLKWFFIRSKPFSFNIEELATVFHFPIETVKTPLTPRVEAKKGGPPTGLPVG